MNSFERLDQYEQKIGKVIESLKSIEYLLDCIILNRIEPEDSGFVQNIVLNSSVVSLGAKIKILKTICNERGKKENFLNLHRLVNIRNLLAHETSYVEHSDMIIQMNELRQNGKYINLEFEKIYQEFIEKYNEEYQKLTELLSELEKEQ